MIAIHPQKKIEVRKTIKKQIETSFCLLYTSDAADERSSVDLGGRRIIKKKQRQDIWGNDGNNKKNKIAKNKNKSTK